MLENISDKDMLVDIMKLRALGYSQEEIANKVGTTQNTVSEYLSRVNDDAIEEGDERVFMNTIGKSVIGRIAMGIIEEGVE